MSADSTKRASTEDFDDKTGGAPAEVVPIELNEVDELYIDPKREARLVRKLDLRIAPLMSGIFLVRAPSAFWLAARLDWRPRS